MPVITDPPVLIDPITFSRQGRNEENPFLFQHAGVQYLVLVPGAVGSNGLGVWVSLDAGATWAEVDAAGKPTGTPRNPCVFYDSGAGTLDIYYQHTTGWSIVVYTLAGLSSTWGTAGTALNDGTSAESFLAKRTGGDYVLFTVNVAGDHVVYYTNTAGVWSSATNLIAKAMSNSGTGIKGGAYSTTDVAFFTTLDNAGNVDVHRISAAFAVASTNLGFISVQYRTSVLLDEANDNVIVNWDGNQEVYADIGTPLSAPAYTHYTLFSEGGSSQVSYPFLAIDANGKYNSWFTQVDYTTMPITDLLWQTVFDGISTWSAPIVYYDEVANEPANSVPDQNDQFIHTGDAVLLADGSFLVAIALETLDGSPAVNHCTEFVLRAPVAPTGQTLTLIKVVQGGSAAPSDFTLSATGGSPETTISGPGPQVGPDDVNAGTFELSEVAPGGATWDSATSTWDGVTTWDSGGQYTPVWDCAGAPMPTPTSVVVSPGGGGPIALGVTQVPDVDPTFQPLLSNGPYEFLIGGFFYQVLWNSGNRLGMFRRQASVAGMFTEADQTNAPTGISGYGRATSRNTIISVCYMLPGNTTAQQVEFDVVAGTWGTPSLPVTLPAVTNLFCWVRRSDNTDVFVGAWSSQWYYITNIAGVWGAVTNIHAHLGTVLGGVIDSNDTIWFDINYDFGANLSSVGLYPLSSTYVLGSAIANRQLIFQGPPFPYRFYPDVALYGTDAIAFAYSTAVNPTDNCQLRVDIIRPLSAPVLTSFLVIISPAGSQSYLLKLHDDGSGVLNLFYVHETTAPTNQVLQTIWTDPFNWSAPTVFYDPAVTPPFAGAAAQQISSLSPLPSNGWAVGAGMQTDQPTEITTAEIIQESSGGGSSDVVCTVTNFFTGPPPNPPGPGQMNPVGCFELLRVDVTLMPARHLPVRGSVR